jgi:hypothetical protein
MWRTRRIPVAFALTLAMVATAARWPGIATKGSPQARVRQSAVVSAQPWGAD